MSDEFKHMNTPSSLSTTEKELWNFALNFSDTGLWHWNLSTDDVFWSTSFIKLIGADPTTFKPNISEFHDRLHPEDLEIISNQSGETLKTHPTFDGEFRLKHTSGHYIWVRASGQTMSTDDGQPKYIVGSITDITESVAVQEELRRSKDELRLIFDNVPVRIWYKDDENRILRLNEQAAASMGMSVADAEGQDTYDLFPEFAKKYHEDDLKVINSGTPELGIIEEYTPLEGERGWVRTDKIPYTDPQTQERAVLVASLDVTQQKDVELSLQSNIERFELAVAGAIVGMWDWVMVPTESLWWSPRLYSMMGLNMEEVEPSFDLFMTLIHPLERDDASTALFNHIEKHEPYNIEIRMQHATAGYKWFLASGQAQWDENGNPTRMVGSLMDIDELKQTQISLQERTLKLERSNSDLEQFAYVASHDLKAPLRGLDNLAQWISEDIGDDVDDDIKEKLELMRGRVARMEVLLADILAYSRAGSEESPPEALNLNTMVEEIVGWIEPPPGYSVTIPQKLPKLLASRTVMEHVLLNLISNAIKHNPNPSGTVEITCVEHENMFEISIIDDGMGIAPEHHEKIFQMFTTLKGRDKVEGSGVGLAIVKKMLTSIGQDIWVKSPGKNGGTEFHFTMPKT